MLRAVSDWTNACGGKRWRTLPNGAIEVEGEGVITWPTTSLRHSYLTRTWENWGQFFMHAAEKFKVPAAWLVAIATQETGLWANNPQRQASIVSTDGFSSVGIMQPIPAAARMLGYTPDDRYNPKLNIEMGADYLARGADAQGFPRLASKYNAGLWSKCKPGNDRFNLPGHRGEYVDFAIRYLNSAIALGIPGTVQAPSVVGSSMLLKLGSMFLGAAGVLLAKRLSDK